MWLAGTRHCGLPRKPMVPLFWDQYDNAQRIDEIGAGVRLDTYTFEAAQLTGAIDRLLGDTALQAKLALDGERIRSLDGTAVAADRIEAVAAGR